MRLSSLLIVWAMLVGAGCTSPLPVSSAAVAQQRARQDLDRLNARVIRAYQGRQQATLVMQQLQTRLRQAGLSPKERANDQADLEEATRQLAAAAQHVAELEAELRQEWATYRARYGGAARPTEPLRP